MKLSDKLEEEVRSLVVQGFDNRDAVFDAVCADDEDLDDEALRDAIEQIFAEQTKAMESWPSLTDCDRLRTAFDALEKQGVVALESPGLTQDDCIPYAAGIAIARDELGGDAHAYCFFTWNDMARAIDGDGLSLAYGTFRDPATAGPRSFEHEVGAMVLEACRDAGLDAEWNGSPDAYVKLPRFRWQRRLVCTRPSDVQDFLDSWELELRAGYTAASDMLVALDERAADWFETASDFGPALRSRLRSHTDQFLQQEQAREATWVVATINDRITEAFEELNEQGVFASECLGLTIQDGWGYAGVRATAEQHGVAFFHHEDVVDAVGGLGLLVAFGAIGVEPANDDAATLALGQLIVSVLRRNGVPCSWSTSVGERIRIEPFEWRRRRWTAAPEYERSASAPEASKRPSFWSRILGRDASKPDHARLLARKRGLVVKAVRDEGGFNVPRARQMRAGWTALGNSGDAQVGHVGVPHVFVPAGEFTSMAPQLGIANLRDEKDQIFLRGVRGRAAPGNQA